MIFWLIEIFVKTYSFIILNPTVYSKHSIDELLYLKSCRQCYTFILFQAFLLYVYYTNSHSHKFKVFSETTSSSLKTEGWVGSHPVLLSLHFLNHRKNAFFLQLTSTQLLESNSQYLPKNIAASWFLQIMIQLLFNSKPNSTHHV